MKQKRILHVFNVLNRGGAETFVYNLYKNIDRDKYKFDFLIQSQEEGAYEKEFKKMGSNVFHLKTFKSSNPLKVIKDSVTIIKQNGPYDAIHIPMQFYSPVYCVAAKIAGIKKIIVHSHSANDIKAQTIYRKTYIAIMRFLINKLATIKISCGKKAAEYLFGANNNATIIYNAVDPARITEVNKEKVDTLKEQFHIKNELVIGHIGSFVEVKNQKFFIGLAKKLLEKKIPFKIILAGNGKLYNKIKAQIRKANLQDSILLPGEIDDVADYYKIFDVFILPSLYEGFPTVIIEAAYNNIPCIVSDTITDELSEIIDNCTYIDINAPYDVWVKEIKKIKKLSKKNDKNKLSVFDVSNVVKSMQAIYD